MKMYFFKKPCSETIIVDRLFQDDWLSSSVCVLPCSGHGPRDLRFRFVVMFPDSGMHILPLQLPGLVWGLMKEIVAFARVILLERPRRIFFFLLTSEGLGYELGYMARAPRHEVE